MNEKNEKIETHFCKKPIPERHSDWSATSVDYEPGDPVGRGATEVEAIADLYWKLEERVTS